jgi:hypothetical protein
MRLACEAPHATTDGSWAVLIRQASRKAVLNDLPLFHSWKKPAVVAVVDANRLIAEDDS